MSTSEVWVDVKSREHRKCITPKKAYQLQKSLDIAELAKTLTSEESRKLEEQGWRYCKVLKEVKDASRDIEIRSKRYEYFTMPVGNKYGDYVLWSKLRFGTI